MKLYGGSGKKRRTGGGQPVPDAASGGEAAPETASAETAEGAEGNNGGGSEAEPRVRTPEELEEIEALVESYRKYKKKKRIACLSVALTLVFCAFLLLSTFAKPPETAPPRPTPEVAGADGGKASPGPDGLSAGTAEPAPTSARKEGVFTFLLVGLDQEYSNTDTLMVGRFDSVGRELNIVSIPRDTCANFYFGQVTQKKINAVYAFGGGIDALMAAVSDMTGFDIDNYIVVNIKAFTALVDSLGGVYFDIPHDMDYDDPEQDLHIHFNAGYQYLSGADAVKVVRWRQNNDGTVYGDIDRIDTQHAFLMALAKQCLSLGNLVTRIGDYVEIFKTYVKTDLTANNLTWYARELLKLKTEDIRFYTLPSNPIDSIKGFSYGTIYLDEWLKMVNERLNPYTFEITPGDVDIITRNEDGGLYATSGEIAGGYESFLDYDEYLAGLRKAEAAEAAEGGEAGTAEAAESGSGGEAEASEEAGAANTDAPEGGADGTAEGSAETEDEAARDEGGGLFYTGEDIGGD